MMTPLVSPPLAKAWTPHSPPEHYGGCIAMAFQNEEAWLRLHLPVLARAGVPFVFLDGGSVDNSGAVASDYGIVYSRAFNWDFSAHFNFLLEQTDKLCYEKVFRLDPDELVFPETVHTVFSMLSGDTQCVFLPRINFEETRFQWCPALYPDWQARGFYSNALYENTVHEMPVVRHPAAYLTDYPIFHYEGLKPGWQRTLKGLNYRRLEEGLFPLEQLPPELSLGPFEYRPRVPYTLPQPAHFDTDRAPY